MKILFQSRLHLPPQVFMCTRYLGAVDYIIAMTFGVHFNALGGVNRERRKLLLIISEMLFPLVYNIRTKLKFRFSLCVNIRSNFFETFLYLYMHKFVYFSSPAFDLFINN